MAKILFEKLRHVTMPNFVKIDKSVMEILRFLVLWRRRLLPSSIFKFAKFYWLTGSRGPRSITVPNFVKVG